MQQKITVLCTLTTVHTTHVVNNKQNYKCSYTEVQTALQKSTDSVKQN